MTATFAQRRRRGRRPVDVAQRNLLSRRVPEFLISYAIERKRQDPGRAARDMTVVQTSSMIDTASVEPTLFGSSARSAYSAAETLEKPVLAHVRW